MLRLILAAWFFSGTAFAYNTFKLDKQPTREQLRAAEMLMNDPREIIRLNAKFQRSFDSDHAIRVITATLENEEETAAAVDEAIGVLFSQADAVLRRFNRPELADEIQHEFLSFLATKELGDHEAWTDWLDETHDKIEAAIGETWCKLFHFHDLFILNYSIPVFLNPKGYTENEFLDHFAGHLASPFRWKHHGLAGVVAYWTSYGACIAGTTGTGAIPFACSPICEAIEHLTDKRIAPPIGKRIWTRNQ